MEKEIFNALTGLGVYKVKFDRSGNIHGQPANEVTVYIAGDLAEAKFRFAKSNNMSAMHMATVIRSYLKPGIQAAAQS